MNKFVRIESTVDLTTCMLMSYRRRSEHFVCLFVCLFGEHHVICARFVTLATEGTVIYKSLLLYIVIYISLL